MLYRLIVITGPLKGQRITVDPRSMTVGQGDDCTITIPDEEAAQKHAQIEHRPEGLFIRDLGSMNKIIVNKREVEESRLKHGDTVEIGRTRFLVHAVVQAEVNGLESEYTTESEKKETHRWVTVVTIFAVCAGLVIYASTKTIGTRTVQPTEPDLTVKQNLHDVPPNPEFSSEIRKLKEDLLTIRETVKTIVQETGSLSSAESAGDTVAGEFAPPESERDVMMKAAAAALESDDFIAADRMLEQLQFTNPNYLPAYELRAQLYEDWGMPGKARDQWTTILKLTTESPMYRRAAEERLRLSQAESRRSGQAQKALKIISVDQDRFRAAEDYDEMRLAKIRIQYDPSMGTLDPNGVHLRATFYEQDRKTGAIRLSQAMETSDAILEEIEQNGLPTFVVSASYLVPRGYYEAQRNKGSDVRYYGFLAQLFYFDQLLTESGRPSKLVSSEFQPKGDTSATAHVTMSDETAVLP